MNHASSLRHFFRCRRLFSTSPAAVRATGAVYAFGDNSYGAAGQPFPLSAVLGPEPVPGTGYAAVAAGHYHSLAVSASGEVFAWGRNEEGQLGRGFVSPRNTWSTPNRVNGLETVEVRSVAASGVISAAIAFDGSLWLWGRSKRGQLGLGKDITEATVPTKVESLSGHHIVKASFGWGHALALTEDGKLFGWGYSENGRLGEMGQIICGESTQSDNIDKKVTTFNYEHVEKLVLERMAKEDNMPIIWEPTLVYEVSCLKVLDISCGLDHSLILCSDGVLMSGGDNTYGQLGRKGVESRLLPLEIKHTPVSVSAGVGHSLALCQISLEKGDSSTGVLSWGWNECSQLGRHGPEDLPDLIEDLNGEKVVSVSTGRVHSVALNSKGEVFVWGSGRSGRLGLGSTMDEQRPAPLEFLDGAKVLQVSAGHDHTLLLVEE